MERKSRGIGVAREMESGEGMEAGGSATISIKIHTKGSKLETVQ